MSIPTPEALDDMTRAVTLLSDVAWGRDEDAREEFCDALEAFARLGKIWIIATVRSDFAMHVQAIEPLARMLQGSGIVPVLPPGPEALRQVVEGPARMAGLTFAERDGVRLADVILRDAAKHPELLPMLEYLLRELFEQRTADGQLTWRAYEELDGVQGALAKRAEHVFAALPPGAQEALNRLLKGVVTVEPENRDMTGEKIVRQRLDLSAVKSDPSLERLVEALVNERLLVTSQEPGSDRAVVTIAHECLLRAWPRAAEWVKENREFLRARSRLGSALRIWEEERERPAGRPEDLLLPQGKPLEDARAIVSAHPDDLTSAEKEFVALSFEYHEQRRQRELMLERERREEAERLRMIAEEQTRATEVQRQEAERQRANAEERRRAAKRLAVAAFVAAGLAGVSTWFALHKRAEAELAARRESAMLMLSLAEQRQSTGEHQEAILFARAAYLKEPTARTRSALITQLLAASPYLYRPLAGSVDAVTALAWQRPPDELIVGTGTGTVAFWNERAVSHTFINPKKAADIADSVFDLRAHPKSNSVAAVFGSGVLQWLGPPGQVRTTSLGVPFITRAAIGPSCDQIVFGQAGTLIAEVAENNPTPVSQKTAAGDLTPTLLSFSPDSRRVCAGDQDGRVTLISETNTDVRTPDGNRALAAAWDRAGNRLALSLAATGIEIWDVSASPAKVVAEPLEANAIALDWSERGSRLACAVGQDVRIFEVSDAAKGPAQLILTPFVGSHQALIRTLKWSLDGEWLASGDDNGRILIWSSQQSGPVRRFATGGKLHGMGASPDGRWVAAGTEDGNVMVWHAKSAALERVVPSSTAKITAIAWQPSGATFACADEEGSIRLQREPWNHAPIEIGPAGPGIWQMKWSRDGTSLYLTCEDGGVRCWSNAEAKLRLLLKRDTAALGLALSPDGTKVAASFADGILQIIHAKDGTTISERQLEQGSVGGLAWSPDGRLLASAANDGRVALVDIEAGKPIRFLAPTADHSEFAYLESVDFSPDGKLVAAAGGDRILRVWSVAGSELVWEAPVHRGHVWQVQWLSPDALLSSSSDGSVVLIDPREQSWLERAATVTAHLPQTLVAR